MAAILPACLMAGRACQGYDQRTDGNICGVQQSHQNARQTRTKRKTPMVGDGTTAIFITFLLAMLGYGGLTSVILLSLRGSLPFLFWRMVAAVILVHVIMVWTFRYEWQFALAVRNGYGGFMMFHSALLMILLSTVSSERVARILTRIAFVVVTIGALGATFLYDVVAIYRVPVIACALAGGGGLAWSYVIQRRRRRAMTPVA